MNKFKHLFISKNNTKDGSFAVGIYTLIISFVSLIIYAVLLGEYNTFIEIARNQISTTNDDSLYNITFILKNFRAYLIAGLIWAIVCILISISLLHGIKNDNRLLLIPWMIWMMIVIVLQSILFVACFIAMIHVTAFAGSMIVVGVFLGFNIYCFSCVYSQYKTLLESNEAVPYTKQKC